MSSENLQDTIIALSSGQLPSGIAVLRVTGSKCSHIADYFGLSLPHGREAKFSQVLSPVDRSVVDEGLVLFFRNPSSFTGEDLLELQLHGSRAVVQFILDQSVSIDGVRLAEPGEFTRRAFENGKLDLTRVEGISDLLDAQTESQRALAVSRMKGGLSDKIIGWRSELVNLRAEIEARLDFADEDDVPFELPSTYMNDLAGLRDEFSKEIEAFSDGKMLREGIRVALLGKPNVGKSSLLNALSKEDTAIVTSIPGTTRDVIEVDVNLGGFLFRFADTAGIRNTSDPVEVIGISRSHTAAKHADLVLVLTDDATVPEGVEGDFIVHTKCDSRETLPTSGSMDCSMSTVSEGGLDSVIELLTGFARKSLDSRETMLISHSRDKYAIVEAEAALARGVGMFNSPELLAEELRTASYSLARLLGEVGTEDVLDRLFEGFCIGK